MMKLTLFFRAALLVPLAVAAGCSSTSDPGGGNGGGDGGGGGGGEGGGDPLGHVQVATVTTGEDIDTDGYVVAMAGKPDRSIGPNGLTTFSDVATGTHQLSLNEMAENCSVGGANPVTASVEEGKTAEVQFSVVCDALPVATLEVTSIVTNNFDPDGFDVRVDGSSVGVVDVDATASFTDLAAGSVQVELAGIAPNCEVDGDNPMSVELTAGGSTSVQFDVVCESPPDGRIVFLGSQGSGPFGVTVMNSDGSGRLLIWECPSHCWRPRWSPDGKEILLASTHVDGFKQIIVIGQDGRSERQVTDTAADDDFGAWSPDGQWIVFSRDEGQPDLVQRLFRIRVDGTEETPLPVAVGYSDESPSWSPDGQRIAFVRRSVEYDEWMLMSANTGGTALDTIIPTASLRDDGELEYFDTQPSWSPDGTRIAFGHRDWDFVNEGGFPRPRVHTIRPDGTERATPGDAVWPLRTDQPRWSPDGTRFVVDDGNNGLHVLSVDGSSITTIEPSDDNPAANPDWGP